jgi:hypothetical protein
MYIFLNIKGANIKNKFVHTEEHLKKKVRIKTRIAHAYILQTKSISFQALF